MQTALLFTLGVLIAVVGLAASIALHEIGHLVPAKRFGVHVSKYMVGFGPTLWSRTRGETEYGVKLLPLGGFISMAGMYPEESGRRPPRIFRTLVQEARTQSDESAIEAEESGSGRLLFWRLPVWERLIIMAGGPFMNLVLAVLIFVVVFSGFGHPMPSTVVAGVSECVLSDAESSAARGCPEDAAPGPALAGGLRSGDRIVSINGSPIERWSDVGAAVRHEADRPVEVVVEREGRDERLRVTPAPNERYVRDDAGRIEQDANGQPRTETVGFLGITPGVESVHESPLYAFDVVGQQISRAAVMVVNIPRYAVEAVPALFGGERSPEGPMSVVGVGLVSGETLAQVDAPIENRIAQVLTFVGGLNVALGVLNLVPLPPLDGGHIAGALYEGLRRRLAKLFGRPDPGPVDMARAVPLTVVVFAALMIFGGLFIALDIVNPIRLFG